MESISSNDIIKWLREENLSPEINRDKSANFHISFNYPEKSGMNFEIVQPKNKKDTIIYGSNTNVSKEHYRSMKTLVVTR